MGLFALLVGTLVFAKAAKIVFGVIPRLPVFTLSHQILFELIVEFCVDCLVFLLSAQDRGIKLTLNLLLESINVIIFRLCSHIAQKTILGIRRRLLHLLL